MPEAGAPEAGARLADLTTLRVGGPVAAYVEAVTEAELVAAVRSADRSGTPALVLGGGSNLLVADEGYDGTAVAVRTRGVARRGRRLRRCLARRGGGGAVGRARRPLRR